MIKPYKTCKRAVAALVMASFLMSDVAFALDGNALSHTSISLNPAESLKQLRLDLSLFDTPMEFSTVKEFYQGDADKPLIIHIQDAHCNYSGQQSLAGTLDFLMDKYGISTVLVEGSSMDASLTSLRELADPAQCKQVSKKLLMEGQIAGEEYLNLTSNREMKILGVEDKKLYFDSLNAYAELADQRQNILTYLVTIRAALEKLKVKYYPKKLLDYEKAKDKSLLKLAELTDEAKMDLKKYPNFSKIKALQEREKDIDFAQANLEQARLIEEISKKVGEDYFTKQIESLNKAKNSKMAQLGFVQHILNTAKEQNISLNDFSNLVKYQDYLRGYEGIDLDKVLEETLLVEDEVYVSVMGDRINKDCFLIRAIDRYLKLLDTAYRIQMTTKEFKEFELNEPDFSTQAFLAFINRKLADNNYFNDLIGIKDVLEKGKASLVKFYTSVNQRDEAFIWNTKRLAQDKAAFLITGGYHTQHLKELFQKEGYSYVVLTPNVTQETNQAKYEKLLLSPIREEIKKVEVTGEQKNKKSLSALEKDLLGNKKKFDGVRMAALLMRLADRSITGSARRDAVRALSSLFTGRIKAEEFLKRTDSIVPNPSYEATVSMPNEQLTRVGAPATERFTLVGSRAASADDPKVALSTAILHVQSFYKPDEGRYVETPWGTVLTHLQNAQGYLTGSDISAYRSARAEIDKINEALGTNFGFMVRNAERVDAQSMRNFSIQVSSAAAWIDEQIRIAGSRAATDDGKRILQGVLQSSTNNVFDEVINLINDGNIDQAVERAEAFVMHPAQRPENSNEFLGKVVVPYSILAGFMAEPLDELDVDEFDVDGLRIFCNKEFVAAHLKGKNNLNELDPNIIQKALINAQTNYLRFYDSLGQSFRDRLPSDSDLGKSIEAIRNYSPPSDSRAAASSGDILNDGSYTDLVASLNELFSDHTGKFVFSNGKNEGPLQGDFFSNTTSIAEVIAKQVKGGSVHFEIQGSNINLTFDQVAGSRAAIGDTTVPGGVTSKANITIDYTLENLKRNAVAPDLKVIADNLRSKVDYLVSRGLLPTSFDDFYAKRLEAVTRTSGSAKLSLKNPDYNVYRGFFFVTEELQGGQSINFRRQDTQIGANGILDSVLYNAARSLRGVAERDALIDYVVNQLSGSRAAETIVISQSLYDDLQSMLTTKPENYKYVPMFMTQWWQTALRSLSLIEYDALRLKYVQHLRDVYGDESTLTVTQVSDRRKDFSLFSQVITRFIEDVSVSGSRQARIDDLGGQEKGPALDQISGNRAIAAQLITRNARTFSPNGMQPLNSERRSLPVAPQSEAPQWVNDFIQNSTSVEVDVKPGVKYVRPGENKEPEVSTRIRQKQIEKDGKSVTIYDLPEGSHLFIPSATENDFIGTSGILTCVGCAVSLKYQDGSTAIALAHLRSTRKAGTEEDFERQGVDFLKTLGEQSENLASVEYVIFRSNSISANDYDIDKAVGKFKDKLTSAFEGGVAVGGNIEVSTLSSAIFVNTGEVSLVAGYNPGIDETKMTVKNFVVKPWSGVVGSRTAVSVVAEKLAMIDEWKRLKALPDITNLKIVEELNALDKLNPLSAQKRDRILAVIRSLNLPSDKLEGLILKARSRTASFEYDLEKLDPSDLISSSSSVEGGVIVYAAYTFNAGQSVTESISLAQLADILVMLAGSRAAESKVVMISDLTVALQSADRKLRTIRTRSIDRGQFETTPMVIDLDRVTSFSFNNGTYRRDGQDERFSDYIASILAGRRDGDDVYVTLDFDESAAEFGETNIIQGVDRDGSFVEGVGVSGGLFDFLSYGRVGLPEPRFIRTEYKGSDPEKEYRFIPTSFRGLDPDGTKVSYFEPSPETSFYLQKFGLLGPYIQWAAEYLFSYGRIQLSEPRFIPTPKGLIYNVSGVSFDPEISLEVRNRVNFELSPLTINRDFENIQAAIKNGVQVQIRHNSPRLLQRLLSPLGLMSRLYARLIRPSFSVDDKSAKLILNINASTEDRAVRNLKSLAANPTFVVALEKIISAVPSGSRSASSLGVAQKDWQNMQFISQVEHGAGRQIVTAALYQLPSGQLITYYYYGRDVGKGLFTLRGTESSFSSASSLDSRTGVETTTFYATTEYGDEKDASSKGRASFSFSPQTLQPDIKSDQVGIVAISDDAKPAYSESDAPIATIVSNLRRRVPWLKEFGIPFQAVSLVRDRLRVFFPNLSLADLESILADSLERSRAYLTEDRTKISFQKFSENFVGYLPGAVFSNPDIQHAVNIWNWNRFVESVNKSKAGIGFVTVVSPNGTPSYAYRKSPLDDDIKKWQAEIQSNRSVRYASLAGSRQARIDLPLTPRTVSVADSPTSTNRLTTTFASLSTATTQDTELNWANLSEEARFLAALAVLLDSAITAPVDLRFPDGEKIALVGKKAGSPNTLVFKVGESQQDVELVVPREFVDITKQTAGKARVEAAVVEEAAQTLSLTASDLAGLQILSDFARTPDVTNQIIFSIAIEGDIAAIQAALKSKFSVLEDKIVLEFVSVKNGVLLDENDNPIQDISGKRRVIVGDVAKNDSLREIAQAKGYGLGSAAAVASKNGQVESAPYLLIAITAFILASAKNDDELGSYLKDEKVMNLFRMIYGTRLSNALSGLTSISKALRNAANVAKDVFIKYAFPRIQSLFTSFSKAAELVRAIGASA